MSFARNARSTTLIKTYYMAFEHYNSTTSIASVLALQLLVKCHFLKMPEALLWLKLTIWLSSKTIQLRALNQYWLYSFWSNVICSKMPQALLRLKLTIWLSSKTIQLRALHQYWLCSFWSNVICSKMPETLPTIKTNYMAFEQHKSTLLACWITLVSQIVQTNGTGKLTEGQWQTQNVNDNGTTHSRNLCLKVTILSSHWCLIESWKLLAIDSYFDCWMSD